MPGQDRVGADDRRNLAQDLSSEQLALRGQSTALVVAQTEALSPELFPKDTFLLLEVVNGVLLVLINPSRKRRQ
jgi:hypothetical protein